jgi:hypothetical protein
MDTMHISPLASLILTPTFPLHVHVVLFCPISNRNKSTGTNIVCRVFTMLKFWFFSRRVELF